MHEMGIATEIYRACRARMEGRGAGRLERVKVAVGELSAVEPDLLRFAWEALLQGEPDEGAALEIEWRPARQSCPDCGEVDARSPGAWLPLCPQCSKPLRIHGGNELDLLQYSFTPAETPAED